MERMEDNITVPMGEDGLQISDENGDRCCPRSDGPTKWLREDGDGYR